MSHSTPYQQTILSNPTLAASFIIIHLHKSSQTQIPLILASLIHLIHSSQHETQVALGISPQIAVHLALIDPIHIISYPKLSSFPFTAGDIFLHIKSNHRDVCFDFSRKVEVLTRKYRHGETSHSDVLHGMLHIDGFLYRPHHETKLGKDLSLFEDGTENPDTLEERIAAACMPDGSSFCLAQQWVHHRLDEFLAKEIEHQERHIGRTKEHSTELDPLPIHSHVRKVTVRDEHDNEVKSVRHSVPYGTLAEYGLFFVSYANNLQLFDTQLRRMSGEEHEGDEQDGLFQFSRPKTGAYFYIPSAKQLRELGRVKSRL